MKYTEENCMDEVLRQVPGFRERWQEHLDFWDGKPAGLTLDMIELAGYTQELLESNAEKQLDTVFALVETLLSEGSEKVKDAVATGFLESTLNPVTKDTAYLPVLVRLLGDKSRAYCSEWLKFSGGELPGLSN